MVTFLLSNSPYTNGVLVLSLAMTNLLLALKKEESFADLNPKNTFPLPFKFDTPFAPTITFLLPVAVVSVTASFPIITLSSPVKPLAVAYPIDIFLDAS